MAMLRDYSVKKSLFQREDGSFYAFSEEQFRNHLGAAEEVVAAFNKLSRELVKFEDMEEKVKNKDYFFGILENGGDFIRNDYRKTLEKELKDISFFKGKRASLIQDAIDSIPGEIFETIVKYKKEAARAGTGLAKPVFLKDLVFSLADDRSCLMVGLCEEYKEDLKAALTENVPESKVKDCEAFIQALEILRRLHEKGVSLTGVTGIDGLYWPGLVENFLREEREGGFSYPLDIESVVLKMTYKRNK